VAPKTPEADPVRTDGSPIDGATRAAASRPRLHTIGMASRFVTPFNPNWYIATVLEGVARAARERNHDLLTFNHHTTEHIEQSLPVYRERCDGLLHLGFDITAEAQAAIQRSGLPLVLAGCSGPAGPVAYADIDNVRAMYDAANHLIALGHRRIAMLLGLENEVSRQRLAGFRQAHADAGLGCGPVVPGSYTTASGAERARELLAIPERIRPTGIVCFNDLVALGALAAAAEMRVRVPEQLSIIGVDDLVEASLARPGLTTIRQPMRSIGEKAVNLLVEVIAGTKPPDYALIVPHEIVVRGSTAAAPSYGIRPS
jgi:LacI family repressor for deo operon, udp, cdd, tsx, nupC, and nupG